MGVKEKCPKVTYLIFDRVPLENFLLSGATRLCSVFNTGLKDLESFVSQLIFCLQPGVKWLWFACHEPCSKTDFLLFTSAEGKRAPLPFWGPSQSFGFSLFPLPMSSDLRSLSANICLSPLWPTFSLNGHFLTARSCWFTTGE